MATYKLAVVDGPYTGRVLLIMFVRSMFYVNYDPTIDDSYRKPCLIDGKVCILDLLDTAGVEEYRAMREMYMSTIDGFLLVYSVVDRNSFEEIPEFYQHILTVKNRKEFPLILVANKTDQTGRVVSKQEGKQLAEQLKLKYVETSVKDQMSCQKMFDKIVRELMSVKE